MQGQIATYNNTSKQDKDFSKLEIRKLQTSPTNPNQIISTGPWINIPLGAEITVDGQKAISPTLFKFDLVTLNSSLGLKAGLNRYELRSTDIVGNQVFTFNKVSNNTLYDKKYLDLYKDTDIPVFTDITPVGELKPNGQAWINGVYKDNYRPTINFKLKDDSFINFAPDSYSNLKPSVSILYSPEEAEKLNNSGNPNPTPLQQKYSPYDPNYNFAQKFIENPIVKEGSVINSGFVRSFNNSNVICSYQNQTQEVSCNLQLDRLDLPGSYKTLIKFTDKGGNSVCNFDPHKYLDNPSISCDHVQDFNNNNNNNNNNLTSTFNPDAYFVLPNTGDNFNTLLITSPRDQFTTDRSVINVFGIGPKSDEQDKLLGDFYDSNYDLSQTTGQIWQVEICVDAVTVPNTNLCDYLTTTTTGPNGVFRQIVILPDALSNQNSTSQNYRISAKAKKYIDGSYNNQAINQISNSNIVRVTFDQVDPFRDVEAISSFEGINTQADIDKFLAGDLTLDDLRTVSLISTVTPNTEAVDLAFADYTNLNVLPNTDSSGYSTLYDPDGDIAYLNEQIETQKKWNPWSNPEIKKDHKFQAQSGKVITPRQICDQNSKSKVGLGVNPNDCKWVYNYLIPFWSGGGIYEVRFRGYKGNTMQDLTRGVAINGQTASAPRLLQVNKITSSNPNPNDPNPNNQNQVARQIDTKFYTNQIKNQLIGVADPGAEIKINLHYQNSPTIFKTYTVIANEGGIWEVLTDIPNADRIYDIKLEATLNKFSKAKALDIYQLILDRQSPQMNSILTENTSNDAALNPWLITGDQIQFTLKTNEPVIEAAIFGELGFREDLFRLVEENQGSSGGGSNSEQNSGGSQDDEDPAGKPGLVETTDECDFFGGCTKSQLATQDFRGRLTILRPLQGIYIPYLKLTDMAGNTVFYGNNPNIRNINIDPFDNDLENSQTKINIDHNLITVRYGNSSKGTKALPANYPYAKEPRLESEDFRLFIDNQKPDKQLIETNGWGDWLNGVYAQKEQHQNNPNYYLNQNPPLPEADRLLTDIQYFTNPNCKVDPKDPTRNNYWQNQNCPVTPAFVVKDNKVAAEGYVEKNQRIAIVSQTGKHGQGNGQGNNTPESSGEIKIDYASPDYTQCYNPNNSQHQNLFPPKTNNGQDPVPGIHIDQKSRGDLITKFAEICKWKYQMPLNGAGESPDGVPQNWYNIAFFVVDLAGNTPVPTSNDHKDGYTRPIDLINNDFFNANIPWKDRQNQTKQNPTSQPNPNNQPIDLNKLLPGLGITSPTITVYSDTDKPEENGYSNIADKNGTLNGFNHDSIYNNQTSSTNQNPQTPNFDPTNTPITNQNQVNLEYYGERRSDTEHQLDYRKNHPSYTSGYAPAYKQILNTSNDNYQGPDNIIDQYTQLTLMAEDGRGKANLNLGTEIRDDQRNCTATSNKPIKNRRVGTCQDGIYNLKMRSTDTSGNSSDWVHSYVERDTVAPGKASLSVDSADESNFNIYLNISGEAFSEVFVAGSATRYSKLGSSGNLTLKVIDLYNYTYSTDYTWNVYLKDRATNESEPVTITFRTKDAPILNTACTVSNSETPTATKLQFPLEGQIRINSNFGNRRDPFTGEIKFHNGIDLNTGGRSQKIIAPADGIVQSYSWDDSGGGNMLVIWHPQLNVRTGYLHLSNTKVKAGDSVKAGQLIAFSGNTGTKTTGPHLHWSVLQGQSGSWLATAINPNTLLYNCADQTVEDEENQPISSGDDEDYFSVACYPYGFVGPIPLGADKFRSLCYTEGDEELTTEIELSEEQIEKMINWGAFNIPTEIDNYLKQRGVNFKAEIVKCALIDQPEEAGNWIDSVRQGFSDLVGFIPFIGDLGDIIISATGRNLLTGKQASCIERTISGIFGGGGLAADLVGVGGAGVGAFLTSFGTEVIQKGLVVGIKQAIQELSSNLASIQLKILIKEVVESQIRNGKFFIDNFQGTIKHIIKVGDDFISYIPTNVKVQSLTLAGGKAIAKVSGKKLVRHTLKLVNLDKLQGVSKKLIDYSLNPKHPIGKNKAKVFKSALGYTSENVDDLTNKISKEMLKYSDEVVEITESQHGKQFKKVLSISGPNGQTKPVMTGWIYDNGTNPNFPETNRPRLVTAYVN